MTKQGNVESWEPSKNDKNAGVGGHGSCCNEMDIGEANSISTAVTPHPCDAAGQTMCEGDKCGGTYSSSRYAGTCDPDGCDFNPYRMGNESFYGPGKIVDTKSKMTVVTQFITDDGTDSGTLKEIKRLHVRTARSSPTPPPMSAASPETPSPPTSALPRRLPSATRTSSPSTAVCLA